MNWDWLAADWVIPAVNIGTFLVALVTAITAVTAIFQTKKMIEQNEKKRTEDSAQMLNSQKRQEEQNRLAAESVERQSAAVELQRQSIEQAMRPIMSVRLLPPSRPRDTLDLEVSNVGRSTAFRVELYFNPPLPEGSEERLNANTHGTYPGGSLIDITKNIFVNSTFETWVPGQVVTSPFWTPNKNFKLDDQNAISAEGVPSGQSVIVIYQDGRGALYEETFTLQPAIWAGKLFSDGDEKKQRKAVERLSESIDKYGESFMKDFTNFLNRTTRSTEEK